MSASASSGLTRAARAAGTVAGVLGALCVIAELCFRFPHHLVYSDARAFYVAHITFFRTFLLVAIVTTFILGCFSVLVLRVSGHGAMALLLGVVAILLGGPNAEAVTSKPSLITAGLDYFILSLLVLALLFVPMERVWSLRDQPVFRKHWQTDLAHFFANHVGVQLLTFMSMVPVQLLLGWAAAGPVQHFIRTQPLWLQLLEVVITVELATYWSHRAFHQVPALWRIHAVHHSIEQMDWLAASRLHLVDTVVTRLAGFVPVFLLGFSPGAVYGYLIFVSFHAIYIHSNVNHRWPVVRAVVTTPEFHHWHHAAEPEAIDKNFAGLLACFDSLFGTAYRPARWPLGYGLPDTKVPDGYFRQLFFPFRKEHR